MEDLRYHHRPGKAPLGLFFEKKKKREKRGKKEKREEKEEKEEKREKEKEGKERERVNRNVPQLIPIL
jgi:hypothetical protein